MVGWEGGREEANQIKNALGGLGKKCKKVRIGQQSPLFPFTKIQGIGCGGGSEMCERGTLPVLRLYRISYSIVVRASERFHTLIYVRNKTVLIGPRKKFTGHKFPVRGI